MRFVLAFLLLATVASADDAVHIYGVRKGEKAPVGYVIHRKIPKWAVYGNGWLLHWEDKDGQWWQRRIPRPRPRVCHT